MINFSIKELNVSASYPSLVARTLTVEEANNLLHLIADLLQPIREAWGSGIKVTSGFRPVALNAKVGGVASSAHTTGFAADLVPANGKQAEFEKCVYKLAKSGKIKFDQIIIEKSAKSRWVHVGLYNTQGKQRMQLFSLNA